MEEASIKEVMFSSLSFRTHSDVTCLLGLLRRQIGTVESLHQLRCDASSTFTCHCSAAVIYLHLVSVLLI